MLDAAYSIVEPEDAASAAGGQARERAGRERARLCVSCGRRRALFCHRGEVRADRHHNLCFECYRAELNRRRMLFVAAFRLAEPAATPALAAARAAADRQTLMQDLWARRRRALLAARHALEGRPADQPVALKVPRAS